jgi:hypothetical protein
MTLHSVDVWISDVKRTLIPYKGVPVVGRYLSAGMLRRPEGPGTSHRACILPTKEAGKWVLFNWG